MELLVEKQTAQWTGISGIVLLICGIGSAGSGFGWVHYGLIGGHGIWSGIFLIVPGILGILVWSKRSRGVMTGFLVMCILAIISSTIQACMTGPAYTLYKIYNICPIYKVGNNLSLCLIWKSYLALLLAITIFNAFGAVVALAGSILGCIAVCNRQASPGTVIVHQQQPTAMVSVSTTHQGAYVGPMGHPQQPGGYVQQPGGYPQQHGGYPQQPGGYPQQLGLFQGQPGAYGGPPPQYDAKPVG